MRKKNKNERKKEFMESLKIKKEKNLKNTNESVNNLTTDKKEEKQIEEPEAPSVIAERYLRKELRGEAR